MKRLLPVLCLAIVVAAALLTGPERGQQELPGEYAADAPSLPPSADLRAVREEPDADPTGATGIPAAPGEAGRRPVAAADPPLPILVHGRILAPGGGPAAGARVFARTGGWYSIVPIELDVRDGPRPAGQEAIADGDGRFAMHAGLEPGSDLALSVLYPGCATERRLRLAFPFAPLDVGTIQMRPGLGVEGRLLDGAGRPVAGADVLVGVMRGVAGGEGSFPGQGSAVDKSNAQGQFRVANLAPGPWLLLFDAPSLCVAERNGVLTPGDWLDLGDVMLETGHAIAGRLSGVPDERMALLRVEARLETLEPSSLRRGRRTQLAVDGSFRIEGIHPSERVRVRVLEQDGHGNWYPVPEVPQPVVPSGTLDLALTWGDRLALTALVADPAGAPIEHFRAFADLGYFGGTHEIGAAAPRLGAPRHPGGRLEASGMRLYSEESTPRLILQAAGFQDLSRTVTGLVPGREVALGTLTMTPAARLLVFVQDPDGNPVKGARLTLSSSGSPTQEATSDGAGQAALNANAQAPQLLVAQHPDWATERREVPASTGSTAHVDVTLQPGCSLTVRVTDPEGKALPEHPVEWVRLLPSREPDPAADPSLGHTGAAGEVHWTNLAAGAYRIRRVAGPRTGRDRDGVDLESEIIQLVPGEPATLHLTAAPEAAVIGVVRDPNGPLSTATLRLGPPGAGDGWRTRYNRVSSSFGEFRFERIPHGNYTLQIEHDSRAMLATVSFPVPPPVQPAVIELPIASVRLRVLGPAGRPQAGATVELSTGLPGQDNPNRGWNDARRAWTDERGDLQQAWHQDPIHLRSTGPDGWVQFDGCLPGVEFHLHLSDPWLVARGPTAPLLLADGEALSFPAPLIAFPAGALEIHPIGESAAAWRVEWNGPDGLDPELRFREGALVGSPLRLDHCPSGPSELFLLRRTAANSWEQAASLLLDLPQGSVLAIEADLAGPSLQLR